MADRPDLTKHSQVRLILSVVAGVAVGVAVGLLVRWDYGVLGGWIVGCGLYLLVVFVHTRGLDAAQTRTHATREDPGRRIADALTAVGVVVGMTTVVVIIVAAHGAGGPIDYGIPALGLVSIIASWLLVQTLYLLRYARLYYRERGHGVDFNQQEDPTYGDFAYLAFTLGMTYQVSDTNIGSRAIRQQALAQALISYLFGAFILAATINVVAGLGS
ncbi:MAG: hypothetical protein BGO95_08490 [Micrococcales bacterium 73-13]|nr:MAG: hypothetical protein BGO95_08490 [Micrococcales bacterium 73-13]